MDNMALGWLLVAGIIGAALASSDEDYGPRIPATHKRCNDCYNTNVSVYVIERTSGYVKLLFKCKNCGRRWSKKYFI